MHRRIQWTDKEKSPESEEFMYTQKRALLVGIPQYDIKREVDDRFPDIPEVNQNIVFVKTSLRFLGFDKDDITTIMMPDKHELDSFFANMSLEFGRKKNPNDKEKVYVQVYIAAHGVLHRGETNLVLN